MGQKQNTKAHFDNILDNDDEENITILQRNGSPRFKKQKDVSTEVDVNRRRNLIIIGVVAAIGVLTVISLNILLGYFIVGSYAFDKVFLIGRDSMHADCVKNTYESFTTHGNCEGITTPNSADFSRFIVPLERLETNVSFFSRDPEWLNREGVNSQTGLPNKGGVIRATFYNADNMMTRPTIIAAHGYKTCRKNSRVMLASAMLWKHNYNVLAIDLRNHGTSDEYQFQKPYTTFGSEEHKDILGAYDYLVERYRNATGTQNLPIVSVYGESMGGSTALIAMQKEQNITSAFLDSPPCNVRRTIEQRFTTMGFNQKLMLSSACATAGIQSAFGCPPFANDPEDGCKHFPPAVIKQKRIHFEWTKNDMIVPIFNLELCQPLLVQSGVNVSVNVMESGRPLDQNKCNDHVYNALLNTTSYETRLLNFYDETLLQ